MLNKKYLGLQNQLDNLTKLRLRDLVDDDEFVKERKELQNQIIKVRAKLDQSQDRGQNWVDLVEKAFNFATYAREKFISGDLQTKREILSALGQIYNLKGGELYIEPVEWLTPISNLSKIEENEIARLEPTDFRSTKTKNRAFAPVISDWGGLVEDIRTKFIEMALNKGLCMLELE